MPKSKRSLKSRKRAIKRSKRIQELKALSKRKFIKEVEKHQAELASRMGLEEEE